MPETPSFRSGDDSPFRRSQIDGESDIVGEESEAGPFRNCDVVQHGRSW